MKHQQLRLTVADSLEFYSKSPRLTMICADLLVNPFSSAPLSP
jgi:hypothetical protein